MAAMTGAKKNACALGGTRYCALLNMRSCEKCTVRGTVDIEQVRQDLDLYETLLPEEGVSRLFLSHECQFCRSEPKGARHGYAILDMAHPEPQRLQRRLFMNRVTEFGTMIPLQFAVCRRCRRRFLWIEYAAVVLPVLFGLAGLGVLMLDGVRDALSRRLAAGPFLLWAGVLAIGALAGALVSSAARRRYDRDMVANVLEHPVVRDMLRLGWTPITKQSRTKLLFSRSRLAHGLGTAVEEGTEAPEASYKNRD